MYLKICKIEHYEKALKWLDAHGYEWGSGDPMMVNAKSDAYLQRVSESIKDFGFDVLCFIESGGVVFGDRGHPERYGNEVKYLEVNTINK